MSLSLGLNTWTEATPGWLDFWSEVAPLGLAMLPTAASSRPAPPPIPQREALVRSTEQSVSHCLKSDFLERAGAKSDVRPETRRLPAA